MKRWRVCPAGWFLLCLAVPASAAPIEYIHINASEGTASGGHVALKLGDEVFHFQHVPPGLLRIKRDDFAQFRLQYGERENRTIRLHRVEVAEDTRVLLREHFNRILLIEDEQYDGREGLEQDRLLLKALLRQAGLQVDGPQWLELKGLGLFLTDGWQPGAQSVSQAVMDGSLARLARRLEARHGTGFLKSQADGLLHRLKAIKPEAYDARSILLAESHFLPAGPSFAGQYLGHLSAMAALHVLAHGLPLRPGVLLRPEGVEFRLDEAARIGLAAYRAKLEDQLLGLVFSQRPDQGFSLLVGMARLIALDASIASGRLAFLNLATDQDGTAVQPETRFQAYARSRSRFMQAKSGIAADSMDEWAYVRLEQSANLLFESGDALRAGRMLRWSALASMPARPAKLLPIPIDMSPAQLEQRLRQLDAYRSAYEAKLAGLYAYDLLGRNCASEIFRVIDSAMRTVSAARDGAAESIHRLGGHVSGQGLDFIPFVSFDAVGRHWRVSATEELPSYRLRRLRQAQAEENPLLVELRESNVFSSSLYHWHGGDAAFVFFTDDTAWARPVAGAFNLAAGLAQGLAGLFSLPWDRGENLWQGTKGALISLPELAFFNIRKGSFPELAEGQE